MKKKQELKYKYAVCIFTEYFQANVKKLSALNFDESFEKIADNLIFNSIMIKTHDDAKKLAKELNKKRDELTKMISSGRDYSNYFLIKYAVYIDNTTERFKCVKLDCYESELQKNRTKLQRVKNEFYEIDESGFGNLEGNDDYTDCYTKWEDFIDDAGWTSCDCIDIEKINLNNLPVKFFPSEKSAKLFVTEMNKIIDKYDVK